MTESEQAILHTLVSHCGISEVLSALADSVAIEKKPIEIHTINTIESPRVIERRNHRIGRTAWKLVPVVIQGIKRDKAMGMTRRAIARKYDIGHSTVDKALKR